MTEGQSARISDLDQNFCFEAQTTLASPWTSFEGFITLITAEKRKRPERTWRLEEAAISHHQNLQSCELAQGSCQAIIDLSIIHGLPFLCHLLLSLCDFAAMCGWFLLVRGKVWSPKNVLDIVLNFGFELLSLSNCLFGFGLWRTLAYLCSCMRNIEHYELVSGARIKLFNLLNG